MHYLYLYALNANLIKPQKEYVSLCMYALKNEKNLDDFRFNNKYKLKYINNALQFDEYNERLLYEKYKIQRTQVIKMMEVYCGLPSDIASTIWHFSCGYKVSNIQTDFDTASMTMEETFKSTPRFGCGFHFCQRPGIYPIWDEYINEIAAFYKL